MEIKLTFDEDGYPSEETCEQIGNYPIKGYQDCLNLLRQVKKLWKYDSFQESEEVPDDISRPSIFDDEKIWFRLATVGWSGNESIISALEQNRMFWALSWCMSQRGGLYVFCFPERDA